ncbi:MAG: hypothetical protein ACFFDW_14650 [Candidatus Thorarchaeota archaeon]
MKKNYFFGVLFRFSILTLLFGGIVGLLITIERFPPDISEYTLSSFDWKSDFIINSTNYNIVLDCHSHNVELSLEENILWHISHGFNATFMTDHNTIGNLKLLDKLADKYKDRFIVLPGEEWTTDRVHLLLLGIREFVPVPSNQPTNEEIITAINKTHSLGGLVAVTHIPWSTAGENPRMPNHPSRAELLEWGVDYIEMVNENIYDIESENWCNDTNGFGVLTGTDMHSPMNVYGWTLVNSSSFTRESLMEQLVARNTWIIFDENGSQDKSVQIPTTGYTLLHPLISAGSYFLVYTQDSVKFNWINFSIIYSTMNASFIIIEIIIFVMINKQQKKIIVEDKNDN